MAWYTPISFNRENFVIVVVNEFDKIMMQAISNRFSNLNYEAEIVHYRDGLTGYEYDITFEDLRAWVMFFGSGEYMESESGNPYLEEYKKSTLWNPHRESSTVVGRGEGLYTRLDFSNGETYEDYSTGGRKGKKLGGRYARKKRKEVDFWGLIEMTWRDFESLVPNAIDRIDQRVNEYITVGSKKTV